MFRKCKSYCRSGIGLILIEILLSGWVISGSESNWRSYTESCLGICFDDTDGNVKLKKWELKVTEKGFFRLRKYFPKGKEEYFSFNVRKFVSLDYLGTEESGTLLITTRDADVIVQTYNDPAGNIDSMSNILKIPVKNIKLNQLDSLARDLMQIKIELK